jgi:hypothetical protein
MVNENLFREYKILLSNKRMHTDAQQTLLFLIF